MGKRRKVIKSQSYTKTTYDRPPPQQSSISKDVAQKEMWLIIQKVTSVNKDLAKSIKDMIATADPQQLQAFFQSNKEIAEKLMDMMRDPRLLHLMVSRIHTN